MVTDSRCELDSEGYVSLGSILATYTVPINEDHAWALCHQCAKYFQSAIYPSSSTPLTSQDSGPTCSKSDLETIKINAFGHVKLDISITDADPEKDFLLEGDAISGYMTMSQAITKVAVIIYRALDYGIPDEEERLLGVALENLLEGMASTGELASKSFNDSNPAKFGIEEILQACYNHWNQNSRNDGFPNADLFYQDTCKALVLDALELTKFIDIARKASITLQNFCSDDECTKLNLDGNSLEDFPFSNKETKSNSHPSPKQNSFKSMAKIWIQVVRELKQGVTLNTTGSTEKLEKQRDFEKTPYEHLMEDIRHQRYHLKKVPNEEVATTRKIFGLHDIIMEYIRSRPKLRRASDRVLQPSNRERDPYEDLMNSIRTARLNGKP